LELNPPPGLPTPLGRAASRPAARLLSAVAQRVASGDTGADLLMWHHQEHVEQPKLARGEGPIGRYRQWARQFYTGPAGDPPTGTDPGEGATAEQPGPVGAAAPERGAVPGDRGVDRSQV
jgi:hypothetical protein